MSSVLSPRVVERLVAALVRHYPTPWSATESGNVASADYLGVVRCSSRGEAEQICAIANGEECAPTAGPPSDQDVLDAVERVRRWHPNPPDNGSPSDTYNLLADFAEREIASGSRRS